MDYSKLNTTYDDTTSDSDYYFKRTFYNETTAAESDVDLSDYWQASEEYFYITPDEVRVLLQFSENDYPTRNDLRTFLKLVQKQITLDVNSSNQDILFIASFLLSKFYVLRGLATRSISKGYITVNAEGRQVTKAFQELVLEAENTKNEYNEFITNNGRVEVGKTNFMDDTTVIDSWSRKGLLDIWTGTQNAYNFANDYLNSYGWRDRRS